VFAVTAELRDRFGRKHDYLRVSVTDRCNLRCVYCMGPEGVPPLQHSDILSYEEILAVVKAGAELGMKSVRLTGGEPLVRKGIEDLVKKIALIPSITDLSMTTNGQLLAEMVLALKRAGLQRVNISLDTLDPQLFREITRCGDLEKTLEGIRAALDYGLNPVKINVVLMKGVNEQEIDAFVKLVCEYPLQLRFIEYMPLDAHDRKWKEKYLPLEVVKEKIKARGYVLEPCAQNSGFGPAEIYQSPHLQGTIGFIHPVSRHFCESCNRFRLTADGFIKPCLYWQEELSVKPFLHDGRGLKEVLQKALEYKRQRHTMGLNLGDDGEIIKARGMSKIGG
jgi:cyclic pyranopterin phosphate synthase